MAKIFFAGIKHSGKTRMAKLVSDMIAAECSDADALALPLLGGVSVRAFYRSSGKDAFMEKEYEAVRNYAESHSSFILSLGGGASDNARLRDYLKTAGKVVYLRRNEEDMLPVILKDGIPPFLDKDDPALSFHKLYMERDRKYLDMADLVLELGPYGDKEETAKRILEALKENGYVQ